MPHRIIRRCIVQPVKPHQLVKALVDRAGGALPVAVAMKARTFQGTLWKICDGKVASPSRASAERIAAHFGIPVEAIYDEKIATDVWRAKFGGGDTESQPRLAIVLEPKALAAPSQWPFRRMSAEQWAALDDYDRALVEAAAVAKLRSLLAERVELQPATAFTPDPKDAGKGGGMTRDRRQSERRAIDMAIETERRAPVPAKKPEVE